MVGCDCGRRPTFFTIVEVADALSVSTGQAYRLVRSGELPAFKLTAHGQWRVDRRVLESFILDRYEDARRAALWSGSEFSGLLEGSFGGAAGEPASAPHRDSHWVGFPHFSQDCRQTGLCLIE